MPFYIIIFYHFLGCVHFLTATKFAQYIRSPGWPKRSPRGLNCYWHIKGPPGSQISTFLDSFHVDPSNSLNVSTVNKIEPYKGLGFRSDLECNMF